MVNNHFPHGIDSHQSRELQILASKMVSWTCAVGSWCQGGRKGTCEIGAGLDVLKWTCLVAPFSGVVLTKKGEDWIDWGCRWIRWMQYEKSSLEIHEEWHQLRMLRSGMKSLAPRSLPWPLIWVAWPKGLGRRLSSENGSFSRSPLGTL